MTSCSGNFHVVGRFCDDACVVDPDFKLSLSTNVDNADFQLGYCMTGTLERGRRADGRMEMTHYAMIKRKGYWLHARYAPVASAITNLPLADADCLSAAYTYATKYESILRGVIYGGEAGGVYGPNKHLKF